MGGFGSGQTGGRPTVESGLTLDICWMLREGQLRPGARLWGSLAWRSVRTGEETSSIGYEGDLRNPEDAWLRLHYTTTRRDGRKDPYDFRVWLETTRPNFGGVRWWFVCPTTGQRAAKLYLPNGGDIFASRLAYRLGYQSQRETPRDRALEQAVKIRERLGQRGGGIMESFPWKPPRMHWETYRRMRERAERYEQISWAFVAAWLGRC